MYEIENPGNRTKPSIYYARDLSKPGFSIAITRDKEEVMCYDDVKDNFEYELRNCLESLFDLNRPFVQTEITSLCTYCSFKQICGR